MAPITWRNINAPDFRDSILALGSAGHSMDSAAEGINKLFAENQRIGNANWDNQSRINTEDAISQLRSLASLPEYYQQKDNFDMAGLRPRFGAQINAEAIQAALGKRLAELNDSAVMQASRLGRDVTNQTGSLAQGTQAATEMLQDLGVQDPRVMQAGVNTHGALAKGQEQGIAEAQDQQLAAELRNELTGTSTAPMQQSGQEILSPDARYTGGVSPGQVTTESNGRDFDKNGNILTSPKGALGRNQILMSTALDPGLPGVRPMDPAIAKSGDKQAITAELARVSNEYMDALRVRYNGNEVLARAAYNAGIGRVDSAGGVPNIPETKDYIVKSFNAERKVPLTADQTKILLDTRLNNQMKQDQLATSKLNRQVTQDNLNKEQSIRSISNDIVAYRKQVGDPGAIPENMDTTSPFYTDALQKADTATNALSTFNKSEQSNIETGEKNIDATVKQLNSAYDAEVATLSKKVDSYAGMILPEEQLQAIATNSSGLSGVIAGKVDQPGILKDALHTNAFHDDVAEGVATLQASLYKTGKTPLEATQYITTALKLAGADRKDSDGKNSIKFSKVKEKLGDAIKMVDDYNAAKTEVNVAKVRQQNQMADVNTLANALKNTNRQLATSNKLKNQKYQEAPEVQTFTTSLNKRIAEITKEKPKATKIDISKDPEIQRILQNIPRGLYEVDPNAKLNLPW